jgi:hypothetical protein
MVMRSLHVEHRLRCCSGHCHRTTPALPLPELVAPNQYESAVVETRGNRGRTSEVDAEEEEEEAEEEEDGDRHLHGAAFVVASSSCAFYLKTPEVENVCQERANHGWRL